MQKPTTFFLFLKFWLNMLKRMFNSPKQILHNCIQYANMVPNVEYRIFQLYNATAIYS
jgi:hypothetical protein